MHADGYFGAEQAFAKMLAASPPPPRDLAVDPQTASKKWFAEMILLAQDAYTRPGITVDGKLDAAGHCQWAIMLDESYERWAQNIAREQIRKAGFRLAALLVAIFPNTP
jgi:hypothetical protein